MGTRADYRERFTSLKKRGRGVLYPETFDLWTAEREREFREAQKSDNEELVEFATERLEQLAEAQQTDPHPLVLVSPKEMKLEELRNQLKSETITRLEFETEVLVEVLHVPKVDNDGRHVLEDGRPVPGEKLYEAADKTYLLGHAEGDEVTRLRTAALYFVGIGAQDAAEALGNLAREAPTAGSSQ